MLTATPKVLTIIQQVASLNLFELAEFVGVFEVDADVSKLSHVLSDYINPKTRSRPTRKSRSSPGIAFWSSRPARRSNSSNRFAG